MSGNLFYQFFKEISLKIYNYSDISEEDRVFISNFIQAEDKFILESSEDFAVLLLPYIVILSGLLFPYILYILYKYIIHAQCTQYTYCIYLKRLFFNLFHYI